AVIDAAQALLLVAPVEKARAAVRATVADQSDRTGRGTKRDEVLAQQAHPQRRAVARRELARQGRRHPVLAHQVAHRCVGSHATEQLVVFPTQHGATSQFISAPRPARPAQRRPAGARRDETLAQNAASAIRTLARGWPLRPMPAASLGAREAREW